MKKLFALLMVAGSIAMYSCGGGEKKEEATTDSTATETQMEAPVDTAAAPVDSAAAAPADSAAAAPAAH
jgi:hypothetical protein